MQALMRFLLAFLVLLLTLQTNGIPISSQDYDTVDAQDIEEVVLTEDVLLTLHGKFDANGDGKVSLAEVLTFAKDMSKLIAGKDAAAILEEIDTNKDGRLSLKEYFNDLHNEAEGGDDEVMKELEKRKAVETQKFHAADDNGDQMLSAQEAAALFYPEIHRGVLEVSVQDTLRQKDHDGDGLLTPKEFWEFGADSVRDDELSEEEKIQVFKKLDRDGNSLLDFNELKAWESGLFHTEAAMIKLLEVADKDGDMHASLQEFENAREEIAASDAQDHLTEWAEHYEL